MKAIVNEKFGPANRLQLKEIKKPVPQAKEILIKTHATSVNTIDIVFRAGTKAIFGLARLSTGIRNPKKKIVKPIFEIFRKGFNQYSSKYNRKYLEHNKKKDVTNYNIEYKS